MIVDELLDAKIYSGAVANDKLDESIKIVYELIENLDGDALDELCGGYQGDIDLLLRGLVTETYSALFGGVSANSTIGGMSSSAVHYLDKLSDTLEHTLRTESLTYFILSVLQDFEMNAHHIEWAEMVPMYKWLCILAARDHGKSFFFSNAYAAWKLYRYNPLSRNPQINKKLGKEGYLFSFSKQQSTRLLTVLKETISENSILRDCLYPGKDGWAETKINCKNGTRVVSASAGAAVRGAHPGWVVVDDFLKDNVMVSKEQRDKYTRYFHSVIMNMIQPNGQVIVVGTPFHSEDLYGDLKASKSWHYREYPSIYPDGRLLWPTRYSLQQLLEKKESQGTVNFSREHLCRPITNESSLFPGYILDRSLVGMQSFTMVSNRDSFPLKFDRLVIGVDLALSSAVGADYTVFIVGGLDNEGNVWILNITRLHGRPYNEQLTILKNLNINFRPDIIVIEDNGFQALFSTMADKEGMPVIGSTTTAKSKNDLKTGIPGLSVLFERGKIKVPVGDVNSRDSKDLLFAELMSVTWTDRGIQATSGHDDTVMALHQLIKGLDYKNTGFDFHFM